MIEKGELSSWRLATLILAALAIGVFVVQRLNQVFDVVFEVCIFYIPSTLLAILYVYFKFKSTSATA